MADQAVLGKGNELVMMSADALDFAPDLLAIQERPPERLPRVIALCVIALLLLLLIWAVFAQRDVIAVAQGRLVPLTFTKVVQPADAGIVTEILVNDGDHVEQGQTLLRMDSRMSDADQSALGADVDLLRISLAFMDAELTGKSVQLDAHWRQDMLAKVRAQFTARRQAFDDAVAQETESLNRARADLVAAEQILSKLSQTLPSYQQSAEAYKRLHSEGFVGELAAIEKGREALEKGQDLRAQTATVASLQSSIAQVERKLIGLRSQYRSQLENDRVEASSQLNRRAQDLHKADVKAGLLELKAPTAGVVKDLSVTGRGAVVAAGTLLLNIVPIEERLQAEVLLQNEDVGFVAVGQEVKVKVAAYPFQKYGMLDGTVSMVSADSLDPKQTPSGQAPTLSYRAIVKLNSSELGTGTLAQPLKLNPGMLVVTEIHQGTRSVLEYLLSPVRRIAQEAARER